MKPYDELLILVEDGTRKNIIGEFLFLNMSLVFGFYLPADTMKRTNMH